MDKIIHCTADVQCELRKAFQLFTDNTMLESWLAVHADVVPEIGGKYELFWEPEKRENNSTLGCKITAFDENQLIAFEWRSPVQFKHFANNADPLTHVAITFIPADESTIIHLVHSGWRSSSEWIEARQWQQRSWSMAFENLTAMVNRG